MSESKSVRIGSAIFNADHGHLADAIVELDRAGIDFFHWDVFDGHFIPDLGFPPQTLQAVRSLTTKPFEVHLAVVEVRRFIAPLAAAGADLIFVPAESTPLLYEGVSWVRDAGLKVGVSIAVGTALAQIEGVLPYVGSVLVLGRIYGEAMGKTYYLPQAIRKIESLHALLECNQLATDIEAAGSLTPETAKQAIAAGATSIVFGGALHKTDSLTQRLATLRDALTRDDGA